MQYKGLDLYPFQEEALRSIDSGRSVIVSAPTGAGKTLIAEYAIESALDAGTRVVYTSPIKALSNQKYRDFRETYGDKVGIMTGDVTLNATAPILIMTTEIFRNTIFEISGRLDRISHVVFDEVHYLGDADRGSVWEESIIFAPREIRFVCLSATISNLNELRDWMAEVREEDVDLVHTDERPVPLHRYLFLEDFGIIEPKDFKKLYPKAKAAAKARSRSEKHGHGRRGGGRRRGGGHGGRGHHKEKRRRHDIVRILVKEQRLPVLYFAFSRRKCETLAHRYGRKPLLTGKEREQVRVLFDDLVERYGIHDHPALTTVRENVLRGVLYHHAGMLPVFKDIVERLFASGLVKLLFTTETFALGVNMPAKVVVFDALTKWNGVEVVHVSPLEFRQMSGRAGRQGIDEEGEVYSTIDLRYDTPKHVGEILYRRPDAIFSMFGLGYATILNLQKLLGDEIETAVEKSFYAWQRKSPKVPLANLRAKLDVLRSRHYLQDDGLTGKGSFCSKLAGFEVHLTELYWEGCFEDLDPTQCAVLCAAMIYEPRKGEGATGLGYVPIAESILKRARKRIREFKRAEMRARLPHSVRPLDFGLTDALSAWIQGERFSRLSRRVSMQEGDLVRAMRLTIQVLRQLAWTLPKDNSVAEACATAIGLINRDEVDAERQLHV